MKLKVKIVATRAVRVKNESKWAIEYLVNSMNNLKPLGYWIRREEFGKYNIVNLNK